MLSTLSYYIVDLLRGREPLDWRTRLRKQRDEFIARIQANKDTREKARHKNTRPAHELSAYAGEYDHPARETGDVRPKPQGGDRRSQPIEAQAERCANYFNAAGYMST